MPFILTIKKYLFQLHLRQIKFLHIFCIILTVLKVKYQLHFIIYFRINLQFDTLRFRGNIQAIQIIGYRPWTAQSGQVIIVIITEFQMYVAILPVHFRIVLRAYQTDTIFLFGRQVLLEYNIQIPTTDPDISLEYRNRVITEIFLSLRS